MATVTQLTEILSIPKELAARSKNQIATFGVKKINQKKNGETVELSQEIFYIFYVDTKEQLVFRNEKKELLRADFSVSEGLSYIIPENKNGVKDVSFVNVLIQVCQQPNIINTSLGLSWIVPIFKVHNLIKMHATGACTAETTEASIDDWIKIIGQVPETIRLEVVEKLIAVLKLDVNNAKTLRDSITTKPPVNNKKGTGVVPQTVTP